MSLYVKQHHSTGHTVSSTGEQWECSTEHGDKLYITLTTKIAPEVWRLLFILNFKLQEKLPLNIIYLQSALTQMQHLLTSKPNVSQQWEQRLEIHRSLRPNKSSIEGDEGEQWVATVITQRMREREQMETDESELSFVITQADTIAGLKDSADSKVYSNVPASFEMWPLRGARSCFFLFAPFYSLNIILVMS